MDKLQVTGRDPRTGAGISVIAQEGLITEIVPSDYDGDLWLTAGLVDLQVNGYRGFDLNGDTLTASTISSLAREILSTGVTSFAPTLITASPEKLISRLKLIKQACENDLITEACIPFIHIEGPHISPLDGYRGAHPLDAVRPPSITEFETWQQVSGNRVGMVTLSPHYDESIIYIQHLVANKVLVSIGHTHATTTQIRAAVDAGASLSTHLGNALPPLLKRHPNPIWSQLSEQKLQAMFIADGHHLAPEVLTVMLRVKSHQHSILVSDLVALAGMSPGIYSQPIGGTIELTTDNRLVMQGTEMLAGAVLPLADCIGRASAMTGLSFSEVLRMASTNPGKLAGNRGALQPGMRADLLQFKLDERSSGISVEKVWLCGSLEFSRLN